MHLDQALAKYINKIQEESSEEYNRLRENCGGYVKSAPKIYNISSQDLAVEVLRFIYEELRKNNLDC
jgi:hypothetical protein